MANDYVETTAGSGGPKFDTRKITVGANTNLHRQAVVITNASNESTADCLPIATDPDASAYRLPVGLAGTIAHDSVDIGSPIKVGAYASAAAPTAVATADRANLWCLPNGQLVVAPFSFYGALNVVSDGGRFPLHASVTAALSNSAADLIAAGGASIYSYITSLVLSASGTGAVQIRRTTGSTVVFAAQMIAGVPASWTAQPGWVLCGSSANDKLELFTAATISVSCNVNYFVTTNALL